MIKIVHLLIEAVYLLLPVLACARAIWLASKFNRRTPLRRFRLTVIAGTGAGVMVCVAYGFVQHASLIFSQVLLSAYLAISLMLLLQIFDAFLWSLSRWIFQLRRHRGSTLWFNIRCMLGLFLRAGCVFCVGLPYVLATVMTYRPHVATTVNPQTLFNWKFQQIEFPATDGTPLVGWWIPSPDSSATQTVLLCPGSSADKATQLSLVRQLRPDGYNVFVFDFRAHGESGGQLDSFGDLERYDVLGAMRWLRQNHPKACEKVAGLGVSTGAAALLAAAADPSPEGQNIDAIAVYGTYDRLDNEFHSMIDQYVPPPLGWCLDHLSLTLAGYQVGAHLSDFSPAAQIKAIWPRPVLIIHGINDEFIPFEEGQSLYDAALEPKMNFWLNRCGHADSIKSNDAANLVKRCFDAAQRVI
jgi:fermentation-respiration switch protein FrsA (DUF1100 family)